MRLKKRWLAPAALLLAALWFAEANYQVPILMYHRVTDCSQADGAPCVSPESFEKQMHFLRLHRYNVITLEALAQLIKSGQRIPRNTAVITFDDGYLDNIEHAFPVLRELGLPATIFMVTDNIGKPGWLSAEDLQILDGSGVSIGSHTVTHAFLPNVYRKDELVRQVRSSHEALTAILNRPITSFSYPAGGVTRESRDLVEEEGYQVAVTTNYGTAVRDPYLLRRIKVSDSDANLFKFWGKLTGLYLLGKSTVPVR